MLHRLTSCYVFLQGKGAAVYYWPGSDVIIDEIYERDFYQYRKNEPIDVRTKQVGVSRTELCCPYG